MALTTIDRRRLLLAGGAAMVPMGALAAVISGQGMPWAPDTAANPDIVRIDDHYIFFTGAEAAFVEAVSARLIPKDELGPGALEAGVPFFIDRQLAGGYGRGDRWYMQGPWAKGLKTQGYQSQLAPADMYRAAIAAINDWTGRAYKGDFAKLSAADQDAAMRQLEAGSVELQRGVDAKVFFTMLHENVMEGFFADPIYGGNRGMAGWALIGFSGARYDQTPFVKRWNQPYPLPPVSIGGRPAWQGQT